MQLTPVHSAGGFTGAIMPLVGFVIIAPDLLFDSARFVRLHDQIMRRVMRAVLYLHHQNTLPGHFEPGAATKYNYQKRTEATRRIKMSRFRHNVDLVEKGKTKRSMLNRVPPVQISGKGSHILTGKMRYRFPFPVSADAKDSRHVTMAKMGKEIAAWTTEEQKAAVDKFAELYAADLKFELASRPRWRRQMEQN
jgi:hypothetical protein